MKTFHKTGELAIFIGVVNFLLFVLISVLIGGDAMNGKIENGHYYLGNHGHLREVSALLFRYSQLHFYSLFVTLPLLAFASVAYRLTGGEKNRQPKLIKIYGIRFPRYLIVVILATGLIVILVAGFLLFLSSRR